MATKKPTSTALVPWEQEMSNAAKASAAREKPPGEGIKKISTQGGILSVDDEAIEGNSLDVIVLAALHENQYYESEYDPRNPTVPVCYAFSTPEMEDPDEEMTPHEKAEGKVSDKCMGCEYNEFGSAAKGRGKACKNIRRLMLVAADEDSLGSGKGLLEAEMRTINVPVMSVKNWAKYLRDVLPDVQRPYYGVVTTLSLVPDRKSQFLMKFEFKELINFDQELWDAMQKRTQEAAQLLARPYPTQAELDAMRAEEEAPTARANSKITGGKGAAAKAAPLRPQGRAAQAMQKAAPRKPTAPRGK